MSTTETRGMCQEVEESLSEILDGTASARLFDHVGECDACRDLKHEAALAGERVRDAGGDFRPAADFVDGLVSKLEVARPASSGASRSAASRSSQTQPSESAGVVVRAGPLAAGGETAATIFDPLAALKVAEAEAESLRPENVTQPSARAPAGATREEAPALIALQPVEAALPSAPLASGVAATTHHSPITQPEATAPVEASAAAEPEPVAPARLGHEGAASGPRSPSAPGRTVEAAPALKLVPPAPVAGAGARGAVSLLRRPALLAGAIGAIAAAALIGLSIKGTVKLPLTTAVAAPWSGAVASVSRASADKTGGLDACDASGHCAPVAGGAAVAAGSTLRTDARTRAHVTLADGTDLAIDRASEVELSGSKDRAARVKHGTVVADVAHLEGSTARFAYPRGEIEVIGTKLAITASDDRASVEVARGNVRVHTDNGKTVDVRAGEEATLVGNAEPVVSSSASLADTMEWSDQKPEDVDSPVLRGLGELRARRPGQTQEKDRAVRLAKHGVKVRVVDVVARTEVDETFTNDTDEELEGIYRFPLPPGAQIEKLSLEVDGKLIDGAFVDRDKGAAIWRGVIQNAAPKAPKPREEIIWVPGPWRDPALLEWQRGGRFELKIFPIPRRGSRRVVLTYTQTVEQSAGIRRFTYPLAHDPSGSTKVGSFDLDVQVLGLDRSVGLQTRGYELQSASGDGDRRTLHADNFIPAGDLTVEYALPDRDKEVTAWAYSVPPSSSPASLPPSKARTEDEKAAAQAAAAIADDTSPYVAIALRPRLPRWQEAKERLHVLVVDASRSMFGERFARATHLASSIVREMDRRDSFLLLACDTTCRPMTADGGGTARPEAPGAAAAGEVERFLGTVEPDGGSDLAAAIGAARTAAGPLGSKELRVLYLGDGTPSVGPTRPAHLETAVRGAVPNGDAAVIAVALGADADTTSLLAMARGGGGVMVPYVPGQKVSSAALEVLGAAYGVVLRDAEVELPAGLSQVSPSAGRLDPIRAGGETIVVARMSSGNEVSGTVKLRGRVAGERFEQSYPLKVLASASAGNAFVPRLYAAAKIAEIERAGGDAQKPVAIELSKRFAVASRFTSLLVLESEAMFKAFGLERNAGTTSFTGEQQAESSTSEPDVDAKDGKKEEEKASAARDEFSPHATAAATAAPVAQGKSDLRNAYGDSDGVSNGVSTVNPGRAGGGFARGPAQQPAAPKGAPADLAAPSAPSPPPASEGRIARGFDDAPSTPPSRSPAKKKAPSFGDPLGDSSWDPPVRRRFVPMRKVFDRHVSFAAANTFAPNASRLSSAESALAAAPNSRDRTVELFTLYSTLGRLGEAQELTARWAGRDALDPDALNARADLAARQGDRDRAVRILGGLADVRPNDRAVQTRLADLQDAAGNAALACEHRIALADMALADAKLVAAAVGCARAQGMIDLASVIRFDTTDKVRDSVDRLLAAGTAATAPRGDVTVSAEWGGGADLDVALIDAQGKRTSWLGSPSKATVNGRDVKSTRSESLEIAGLPQGNYVVEVTRAGTGTEPVRGDVTVRFGSEVTRLPFSLSGPRGEVGTVRVFFTSRLVPL